MRGRAAGKQRVAIWLGTRDKLRANDGICAGLVLDDDGLAQARRKLIRQYPGDNVACRSRGKRVDDLHGPIGPCLPMRGAAERKRGD